MVRLLYQVSRLILDQAFEICIRPGLHCAPYTHREIGTLPDGTIRVSSGAFSTPEHIGALCHALTEISQES